MYQVSYSFPMSVFIQVYSKESDMTLSTYIHISSHMTWLICKRVALELNRNCHSGNKNLSYCRCPIIYFCTQHRIYAVTAVPVLAYCNQPTQIILCLFITGFIDIYLIIHNFMASVCLTDIVLSIYRVGIGR